MKHEDVETSAVELNVEKAIDTLHQELKDIAPLPLPVLEEAVDGLREGLASAVTQTSKMCETHISTSSPAPLPTVEFQITDPMALIAMAKDDPIRAMQKGKDAATTLDVATNHHKIALMCLAYEGAYRMERDFALWRTFCADPGWAALSKLPLNSDRYSHRKLYYTMRFVFQAESPKALRRARVRAKLLQRRFDNGEGVDTVLAALREKGIEAVLREERARRRMAKVNKGFRDLAGDILSETKRVGKGPWGKAQRSRKGGKEREGQAVLDALRRYAQAMAELYVDEDITIW